MSRAYLSWHIFSFFLTVCAFLSALFLSLNKKKKAVHGTKYTYGPISTTIYPASGSSADYT